MLPPRSTLALAALILSLCVVATAAGQQRQKVEAFVAAAATRLQPGEALTALNAGPPEEYFRWGEGICRELKAGRIEKQVIEGNLDQFFGPELAGALVYAAKTVICPESK